MTMKKKIVIVALVVCIFAMSIASATLAYFTDTEGATNTFTIGNVDIKLGAKNANNVMEEIDDDNADSLLSIQNSNVYPTQTIEKDVTITNISGTGDAVYAAAIVKISGINGILSNANTNDALVKAFLSGGAINNDTANAVKIVYDNAANPTTITIYVIQKAALANNGTMVVYEDIVIPGAWNKAQMQVPSLWNIEKRRDLGIDSVNINRI